MLSKYRVPVVEKKVKTGGKKRKTHEEYVEELKIKNPNVIPLEEYQGANVKIKHFCLLHNIEWNVAPTNVLQGRGCIECSREKYSKSKTKTNEQYIKELKSKNPNVVADELYIDGKTAINHKCLIHDIIWKTKPTYVLKGGGCEQCYLDYLKNYSVSKTKTHEQYIEDLKNKAPHIIPLENYINAKTKILHKCLKHDVEWKVRPYNIFNGNGCPECGKENYSNSRTKTTGQYVAELNIKNPNLIPLEDYKGVHEKILHMYKKCGHKAYVAPTNALAGSGCMECAINAKKMTIEEYLFKLNEKEILVEPLEKLIDYKTPILHKYIKCGHEYKKSPQNVLNDFGCLLCRPLKLHIANKMTQEEYISKLSSKNDNIDVLEEYINNHTSILHRFKKCGHVVKTLPNNLLSGGDCPVCNKSRLERMIEDYLSKNKIRYTSEYKFNSLYGIGNGKLSYDFYLPDYNSLIEAQGIQHEQPVCFGGISEEQAVLNFEKQQEHDRRKREYAKNNNINLLEIWYYNIDNIEQILTEYLNNLKSLSVTTATSA